MRNADATTTGADAFKASFFSNSDQIACGRRSALDEMCLIKPTMTEASLRTQVKRMLRWDF